MLGIVRFSLIHKISTFREFLTQNSFNCLDNHCISTVTGGGERRVYPIPTSTKVRQQGLPHPMGIQTPNLSPGFQCILTSGFLMQCRMSIKIIFYFIYQYFITFRNFNMYFSSSGRLLPDGHSASSAECRDRCHRLESELADLKVLLKVRILVISYYKDSWFLITRCEFDV